MASQEGYSVPWHVAAVFILLAASLAGSLAPVGLHTSSSRDGPMATAVRMGTFFGERTAPPCVALPPAAAAPPCRHASALPAFLLTLPCSPCPSPPPRFWHHPGHRIRWV